MAAPAAAQYADPDSARIITADIDRFWEAFDAAAPDMDPAVFQELYLSKGTGGLADFTKARIENAEQLAAVIATHPKYYASIRESTYRVAEMEHAIRAAFYALEYLYPDAVFPDVYFVVGRMNSGGTTSQRALLIGVDMYGLTPDTPMEELGDWHRQVIKPVEEIPHIVAHELIHYQQDYPQKKTLLAMSIGEGVADFLAELISGKHINNHVHAWANPREQELWREFSGRMNEEDTSGWLYGGSDESERPADLGYWIGYKIAAAYCAKAPTTSDCVRGILEIDDFETFLGQSGYGGKSQ